MTHKDFPLVSIDNLIINDHGAFSPKDDYFVLYVKDGATLLLQSDMTAYRAVESCRVVNDHEERNGRERKFFVAKRAP